MGKRTADSEWNAIAQALMFKDERHMYEVLYEQERLSVAEIALRLKCGTTTLNRRMSAYKIKKKQRGGAQRGADKRSVLFYMDQRVIMAIPNSLLRELVGCSYSVCYHYKRWKAGGSLIGYYLSSQGRESSMEDMRS